MAHRADPETNWNAAHIFSHFHVSASDMLMYRYATARDVSCGFNFLKQIDRSRLECDIHWQTTTHPAETFALKHFPLETPRRVIFQIVEMFTKQMKEVGKRGSD
jgi:hypothetical protein